MNKAHIRQVYSFIDYLKGGMEINAFIAIDFTGMFSLPLYNIIAVNFWRDFELLLIVV